MFLMRCGQIILICITSEALATDCTLIDGIEHLCGVTTYVFSLIFKKKLTSRIRLFLHVCRNKKTEKKMTRLGYFRADMT